jgi:hypothetical protein
MTRYRTVCNFGGPLSYGYGVNDLPTWLPLRARRLATTHDPSAPQMREQFLLQYTASLDEQASIDRFMGYPHRLIIGVFSLEPSRYLLWRPLILKFLGDDLLQKLIDRKSTELWALRLSPGLLVRQGGTVLNAAMISVDLTADRRR